MSEELNQNPNPEQGVEQQEEQEAVDPIVLLGQELAQIRAALGLGESPSDSSLLQRLNSIESKLSKGERERNLPAVISRADAANPNAMRKAGVTIEDIASGRVTVEG